MDVKTTDRTFTGFANPVRTVAVVALMLTALAASIVTIMAAPSGGTASVSTLGNQERQDIVAANQWVEGNIDFWLESHLYDAEVRIDAGSSPGTVPNQIDVALSFFFDEKNAIVIDWTQDWYVTLREDVMFYTKTSVPPGGGLYQCSTPSDIVDIPVGGHAIQVPQAGSICIADVTELSSPNPNLGWTSLMSLPLSDLNSVLPKRNEPCTTVVSGLCASGTETESAPAKEHYFRVNLAALFGPGGKYPQSWWPNLPAKESLAIYWRNHLAMTAVWKTAIGASGGGSQSEFCITTGPGAVRNTNYDRCNWTSVSREGAGGAQGSKNHGDLFAPGIGQKTIPLPQVVAPTGFITVCKIVTLDRTDRQGAFGTLTNGWEVRVQGPFSTDMTKLTGSFSTGCARFGPVFPGSGYLVSETILQGFIHIGTIVDPPSSRDAGFGANPEPNNPVSVTLTFSQAQLGTGPTVTFVNTPIRGSLRWFKVDHVAAPLGGATFEVCRTHDFNPVTNTFVDIPDVCVTVLDDSASDQDPTDGAFRLVELRLGRYTVRETIPPPGFAADPDTVTVELTVEHPDVTITEPFVDQRPILKISEFGYTNTPIGLPTDGSGTVVYTVRIRNFGGATALVSGSLTVTLPAGFVCVTVRATATATGCVLSWSTVPVAPFGQVGDEVTFVLTVEYHSAPDGTVISATLVSSYTTPPDTLVRDASGSPATISFTVRRN